MTLKRRLSQCFSCRWLTTKIGSHDRDSNSKKSKYESTKNTELENENILQKTAKSLVLEAITGAQNKIYNL